MLLQRRSQIYRSQSVSAAESVSSSVSFLIRIRELLLVLKASKEIAPRSLFFPPLRSPSLLDDSLLPFAGSFLPRPKLAEPHGAIPIASSAWAYRLSIFIATRSACLSYIFQADRSNCGPYGFLNVLRIGEGHQQLSTGQDHLHLPLSMQAPTNTLRARYRGGSQQLSSPRVVTEFCIHHVSV